MNVNVSDIMFENFTKVNLLDSVERLQDLVIYSNIDFFPVFDEGKIKGLVTYRDLIGIHPNRIVADTIRRSVITISYNEQFWKANMMLEENNRDVLLVTKDKELVGVITKNILKIELGKHTDSLTGLFKSSYIYYHTNELVKNKKDFSILFIDINNFGYIDKKIGHVLGDEVIKALAKVLYKTLPQNSYLCRFAGDEFVILLPHSLEGVEEYFDYLRDAISHHKFPSEIDIAVSAGIINYDEDYRDTIVDNNIYSIINKASLACTKAKKSKSDYVIVNNKVTSALERTC